MLIRPGVRCAACVADGGGNAMVYVLALAASLVNALTPLDGDIPRNGLVYSPGNPRVFIGSDYTDQIPLQGTELRSIPGVDVNFVSFSGLSPSIPGMWQ